MKPSMRQIPFLKILCLLGLLLSLGSHRAFTMMSRSCGPELEKVFSEAEIDQFLRISFGSSWSALGLSANDVFELVDFIDTSKSNPEKFDHFLKNLSLQETIELAQKVARLMGVAQGRGSGRGFYYDASNRRQKIDQFCEHYPGFKRVFDLDQSGVQFSFDFNFLSYDFYLLILSHLVVPVVDQ